MPSRPSGEASRIPVDPDVTVDVRTRRRNGAQRGAFRRPGGGSRSSSVRAQAVALASLAGGGALGAVARYAISLAMPAGATQFPWSTFVINVSGSLVLGFVLVVLMERIPGGRLVRMALGTGFIGAYTTFSTFVVEATQLIRHGRPGLAVAYLGASTLAGLGAAWLGMAAAQLSMSGDRSGQPWPGRTGR